MTWTAEVPGNKPIEKWDINEIPVRYQFANDPQGCESSFVDQVAAAKKAVADLVSVVGAFGDPVTVFIMGHATPHHQPYGSSEFINIRIEAKPGATDLWDLHPLVGA